MAKRKTKTARAPKNDSPDGDDPMYYYRRTREMMGDAVTASLDKCLAEMKSDRTEHAERCLERVLLFYDGLTAALLTSDLWRSVYWALRFGSLTHSVLGMDADEAYQQAKKRSRHHKAYLDGQKTTAKCRAEADRDRVALLVNKGGLDVTKAQAKVAQERGVSLRTIQRNCQTMRQG